jgi:Ca-activated chloride channel family protein
MKKLLPTVALVTLILTACRQSAEQLNNAGNQAFAQQDYQAALTAYQNAQAKSPDLAEPYYNAANAYYRQEDYGQAQQQFQAGLPKAQDELAQHSFYNLGNTLFNARQFKVAVEAYKEALRLNPADTAAKHNLELALKQLQQQDQQQNSPDQPRQDDQPNSQPGEQQQNQQAVNQQNQQPDQSPQNQQQKGQPDQQQPDSQQGEQQPDQQNNQQPQTSQEQSDQPSSLSQLQQIQGLTPEQARQLLQAAAKDAKSVQEYLQQTYAFPGRAPAEDW